MKGGKEKWSKETTEISAVDDYYECYKSSETNELECNNGWELKLGGERQ
jgi:hypothetical protein